MTYKKTLSALVENFSGKKILIIGDVMADHYLIGSVNRISPEAPVPVVDIEKETCLLGGAGNVAKNIADLLGSPHLISVCGLDAEGETIQALCKENGISSDFIIDENRPSTKKTRIIANNQHIVRVDQEKKIPLDNKTCEILKEKIQEHIHFADIIVLSDYGKGVICEEFMSWFMPFIRAQEKKYTILVDPKPINYALYKGVDILTPNTKEAQECANTIIEDAKSLLDAGEILFEKFHCKELIITLGKDGMAYFSSPTKAVHIPTFAQKVFDVTGAGDTVIATLALALASGADTLNATILANLAASITVAQVGAATASTQDLQKSIAALTELDTKNIKR